MPHSVFRPLPQLSGSEAEAAGIIARRACQGVRLPLAGDTPWTCSMTSGATPVLAGQCDLGVRLEWSGAQLCLYLPRRTATVWLEAQYRDVQFNPLPDDIFAAAFDAMLAQWVSLADTSGLGKPRVVEIQDKNDGAAQASLPHVWTLSLQSGQSDSAVICVLRCDGFALQLLAGLMARLPEVENDIRVDDVPIEVSLRVGLASLPWNTLRSLEKGDVVLLDRCYIDAQAGLWLCAESGIGLRVRHEGQHYVVTDSWKKIMTDTPEDERDEDNNVLDDVDAARQDTLDEETAPMDDERDASVEAIAAFDEVPVTLSFDLGSRRLPMAELKRMQPGEVFDLQRPLEDGAVRVRANGVTVGYGELVDVDGRIGVRLLRLSQAKSQ